jgi:hypothetical protein
VAPEFLVALDALLGVGFCQRMEGVSEIVDDRVILTW